jgi:hypothetical protein
VSVCRCSAASTLVDALVVRDARSRCVCVIVFDAQPSISPPLTVKTSPSTLMTVTTTTDSLGAAAAAATTAAASSSSSSSSSSASVRHRALNDVSSPTESTAGGVSRGRVSYRFVCVYAHCVGDVHTRDSEQLNLDDDEDDDGDADTDTPRGGDRSDAKRSHVLFSTIQPQNELGIVEGFLGEQ